MPSEKHIFNLENKTAIVTGAGMGLGRSFSITLAEAGANVVLVDRNPDCLSETRSLCKIYARKDLAITADVSRPDDVARMVEETIQEFGSLDVAVNNAGILTGPVRFHEMPYDEWQKVLDINLTGVFLCMQKEIGAMLASGTGGSIINLSSVLGLVGLDADMNPRVNYIASKHGISGLTKQGAVEYAEYGIRVNAIAPAWYSGTSLARARAAVQSTEEQNQREERLVARTPMRRRGRIEELQGLLLFLASDASSYMTGQIIASDGGWTAH